MELSADHSPESGTEFARMHSYRPHRELPHHPELLFVYDTLTASKLACPPIFDVDTSSGRTSKTERGAYYKNVRCEWATLVATPPHAPFQDALAFTRSLGDLHLQTYGVSHTPETWWMDLAAPAPAAASAANGTAHTHDAAGRSLSAASSPAPLALDGGPAPVSSSTRSSKLASLVPTPLSIVVASDGIWDNWKFEEVAAFVLAPTRVEAAARAASAQAAANELMAVNLERARTNFGTSADNMTAIVLYLFPRPAAAAAAAAASDGGGAAGSGKLKDTAMRM
jgi:hypothetical protein